MMPSSWKRPARRDALIAVLLLVALGTGGCLRPAPGPTARPVLPAASEARSIGTAAAGVARSMVGAPYRYGGAAPSGFDCSGLVQYSFAQAGLRGLPRSVRALSEVARPVPVESLEAGDLLFFSPGWTGKKSHVGIYLGGRRFVHAPSSGKSVEVVSFDHVYWGPRVGDAGRLTR